VTLRRKHWTYPSGELRLRRLARASTSVSRAPSLNECCWMSMQHHYLFVVRTVIRDVCELCEKDCARGCAKYRYGPATCTSPHGPHKRGQVPPLNQPCWAPAHCRDHLCRLDAGLCQIIYLIIDLFHLFHLFHYFFIIYLIIYSITLFITSLFMVYFI
jgi:hypothetical protein